MGMKENSITVAHFFSGGCGGILAAEILGHKSILAVDNSEGENSHAWGWSGAASGSGGLGALGDSGFLFASLDHTKI